MASSPRISGRDPANIHSEIGKMQLDWEIPKMPEEASLRESSTGKAT
jgi:hypothetical protein